MAASSSPIIKDKNEKKLKGFTILIPAPIVGFSLLALIAIILLSLASWSVGDPSLSYATNGESKNLLGDFGASIADIAFQFFGLTALFILIPPTFWSWNLIKQNPMKRPSLQIISWISAIIVLSGLFAFIAPPKTWPLPSGLGGLLGDGFIALSSFIGIIDDNSPHSLIYAAILLAPAIALAYLAIGFGIKKRIKNITPLEDEKNRFGIFDVIIGGIVHIIFAMKTAWRRAWSKKSTLQTNNKFADSDMERNEPRLQPDYQTNLYENDFSDNIATHAPIDPIPAFLTENNDYNARQSVENTDINNRRHIGAPPARTKVRREQTATPVKNGFELPKLDLLSKPKINSVPREHRPDMLEARARQLESVLADFGVKGDITNVRPGPVVTLYELEPAPGIKSSRVISLADDIARSMSAISTRIAVVPGRNAIGIELPNQQRETVYLREMLASEDFAKAKGKLNICLGKTIGGEPVIADLAKMPHLLVAGTTGSGKSVAINTMVLSLLYRLTPEQCRLIMIDPKMLELSVYDGIPHLLSPVVTDPAKAVTALKWAVREMEDRYRKMSKIGVRNIETFNKRVRDAAKRGEIITRTVQTGFNKETGEPIYESESFDLEPLPFIVIIVDEMADLMMVAGKDIEGTIQRLAQMARAAGIHLITATQRPSVDVITGTIKANFPTRISFQVTSKIDSRTILGEMGAEQLLGMGDMLYMAGGGRTSRLHGPFCSDREVETVVNHLKTQGTPDYLETITEEVEEEGSFLENGTFAGSGNELYDKAVNIVLSDKKASTSYLQRRLSIGYNRAASLIEKMEQEGIISPANHAGKREILVGDGIE